MQVGGRSAKWKPFCRAIKLTECGVISNRQERSFRSLVQLWLINSTTLNVASQPRLVLREALLKTWILLGRCSFTSFLHVVQFIGVGIKLLKWGRWDIFLISTINSKRKTFIRTPGNF